jgi:hypothetical protein
MYKTNEIQSLYCNKKTYIVFRVDQRGTASWKSTDWVSGWFLMPVHGQTIVTK